MNSPNDPQDLWKSNDPLLPQPPITSGICALARRRERENVWQHGISLFALEGDAEGVARVQLLASARRMPQPLPIDERRILDEQRAAGQARVKAAPLAPEPGCGA